MSAVAALALSWSLYLDTGIRIADAGIQLERTNTTLVTLERNSFVNYVGRDQSSSLSHRAANPYGDVRLVLEVELSPRWSVIADGLHESSISSRTDRGVNSFGVSVRCRLFGSRQ
jgi:hypothetical protein